LHGCIDKESWKAIFWLGRTATALGSCADAIAWVLARRCYMCHRRQVQMKNIRLDSPSLVKQHAQAMCQQVVVGKTMPMNNATGMTEAERALVGQWFAQGASVR
jgi:uncharacterized membrane protein